MFSRRGSFICHDGPASTHLTGGCKSQNRKLVVNLAPTCIVLVNEELAEKLSKGSIIRCQLIDMKI